MRTLKQLFISDDISIEAVLFSFSNVVAAHKYVLPSMRIKEVHETAYRFVFIFSFLVFFEYYVAGVQVSSLLPALISICLCLLITIFISKTVKQWVIHFLWFILLLLLICTGFTAKEATIDSTIWNSCHFLFIIFVAFSPGVNASHHFMFTLYVVTMDYSGSLYATLLSMFIRMSNIYITTTIARMSRVEGIKTSVSLALMANDQINHVPDVINNIFPKPLAKLLFTKNLTGSSPITRATSAFVSIPTTSKLISKDAINRRLAYFKNCFETVEEVKSNHPLVISCGSSHEVFGFGCGLDQSLEDTVSPMLNFLLDLLDVLPNLIISSITGSSLTPSVGVVGSLAARPVFGGEIFTLGPSSLVALTKRRLLHHGARGYIIANQQFCAGILKMHTVNIFVAGHMVINNNQARAFLIQPRKENQQIGVSPPLPLRPCPLSVNETNKDDDSTPRPSPISRSASSGLMVPLKYIEIDASSESESSDTTEENIKVIVDEGIDMEYLEAIEREGPRYLEEPVLDMSISRKVSDESFQRNKSELSSEKQQSEVPAKSTPNQSELSKEPSGRHEGHFLDVKLPDSAPIEVPPTSPSQSQGRDSFHLTAKKLGLSTGSREWRLLNGLITPKKTKTESIISACDSFITDQVFRAMVAGTLPSCHSEVTGSMDDVDQESKGETKENPDELKDLSSMVLITPPAFWPFSDPFIEYNYQAARIRYIKWWKIACYCLFTLMVIRYGFSSFLLYCKDQIPWCYYLALLLSLFVSVALTIFIVLSEFPPRAIVSFIEPTLPPLLMILNTILYMYSINTDTTDEMYCTDPFSFITVASVAFVVYFQLWWMVYIILPTLCFVISVLMYYFLSCSTAHLVSLITFSVLLTILCMTAAYTIDAAWRLAYVVTVPMSILYNESVDMFIHFYPLYLIKRCVKKPQNGYNQINYFRNITVARLEYNALENIEFLSPVLVFAFLSCIVDSVQYVTSFLYLHPSPITNGYEIVGGLPETNSDSLSVVDACIHLFHAIGQFQFYFWKATHRSITCSISIASGSCVAAVFGRHIPTFILANSLHKTGVFSTLSVMQKSQGLQSGILVDSTISEALPPEVPLQLHLKGIEQKEGHNDMVIPFDIFKITLPKSLMNSHLNEIYLQNMMRGCLASPLPFSRIDILAKIFSSLCPIPGTAMQMRKSRLTSAADFRSQASRGMNTSRVPIIPFDDNWFYNEI